MDDEEKEKKAWEARREYEIASDELQKIRGEKKIYDSSQKEYSKAIPPLCSFCGKGTNQVKHLVPGNNANICNECVLIAKEIIDGS